MNDVIAYTPVALRDVPAEAVMKSMNALGRLADPDEIARWLHFCCHRTPPSMPPGDGSKRTEFGAIPASSPPEQTLLALGPSAISAGGRE